MVTRSWFVFGYNQLDELTGCPPSFSTRYASCPSNHGRIVSDLRVNDEMVDSGDHMDKPNSLSLSMLAWRLHGPPPCVGTTVIIVMFHVFVDGY